MDVVLTTYLSRDHRTLKKDGAQESFAKKIFVPMLMSFLSSYRGKITSALFAAAAFYWYTSACRLPEVRHGPKSYVPHTPLFWFRQGTARASEIQKHNLHQ